MIVFGPGVTRGSSPVDLGPLEQYEKSPVTNLGLEWIRILDRTVTSVQW